MLKYIVQITKPDDFIWFLFVDKEELNTTTDRSKATRFFFKEAMKVAKFYQEHDSTLNTKLITIIEAE